MNKLFFNILFLSSFLFTAFFSLAQNASVKEFKFENSAPIIKGVESELKIIALDSLGKVADYDCFSSVFINGQKVDIFFYEGVASLKFNFKEKSELILSCENISVSKQINPIPLWLSILPPLIAILLALIFKEVYTAIFLGIFSGTLIIAFYSGTGFIISIGTAFFAVFDTYIIRALLDGSHVSIIIFSMLIGATVNVISRNGGMQGIINKLTHYADTPRSGQFVTWLMGVLIFFDDYANTLIVGNTIRPITDKLKISREKLAYIVDSTAAPVASIAFVTTWIGAELSYIQSAITLVDLDVSPYSIFFMSLKYCFYPFLTLFFIFVIIYLKRDFGPMYKAEIRARTRGVSLPSNEKKIEHNLKEFESLVEKPKAFNAIIPVLVLVFGTITGLFYTGWDTNVWNNPDIGFVTKLSQIIGNSDSYTSLIRASGLALVVAVIMSVAQKILSIKEAADSILSGFKVMLTAIIILCLAWALSNLISDLRTADFIISIITTAEINPNVLPLLSFIVSALVSFSTGTSWGTMAIMYPLILPATWALSLHSGLDYGQSLEIFAHVSATVISGSVFGDHCSPISDTTILSSLSSSCNHIQHVRTQAPYALITALISALFGTFLVESGLNILIAYLLMIISTVLVIYFFGKPTETDINKT